MGISRREALRLGAVGAGAAMLSSAASSVGLPAIVYAPPPAPRDPLAPLAAPQAGPAAVDPATGLLYVNSNEMAWLLRMIPRDDHSLYRNNCASCHGEDRKGTPGQFPSLIDIGARRTRVTASEAAWMDSAA